MENYYDHIPKHKLVTYANRDEAILIHPYRLLIVGSSGSGKTNTLINLLRDNPVFLAIYIFARSLHTDPLYDHVLIPSIRKIEKAIGRKILRVVSDDIEDLPDMDDIKEPNTQKLVIFDDFMFEKGSNIQEYFTRGRKKNMSLVYISQSITHTPIVIRRNVDSVAATRIAMNRDFGLIANQFLLSTPVFRRLYNMAESNIILTNSGDKGRRIFIDLEEIPERLTENLS